MGLDLRPNCSKCGKIIELDELRAIGNNRYQCANCYEGKTATSALRTGRPTSSLFSGQRDKKIEPVQVEPLAPVASKDQFFSNKQYVCNSCGFQFSREPTKVVKNCPYCGKVAVQEKVDDPASQFIQ